MFTCLEVLPESQRIINRIYERLIPPQPQREFVQLKGATPFLRLKVKENHIDWQKIVFSLSKGEKNMLLPQSLCLPDSVALNTNVPVSLGLNMMFKAFLQTLSSFDKPSDIGISVFDKDAVIAQKLEKLVPFVRSVSVYTEKIKEYFYVSSKIMREWGLSVKIYEYECAYKPSKIILTDRYLPCMKTATLVFSGDNSEVYFNTVTGYGIKLENDLKELKSFSVDDFSFASFLYEYNKAKFLSEREFIRLNHAGRLTNTDKLSDVISDLFF